MKPTEQQVSDLLALKRHERPPEGYMEDFLREYHQRRVADGGRGDQGSTWWKRLASWFSEQGMSRWAYGAGLAYAAMVAIVLVVPRHQATESIAPEAISHPVVAPIPERAPVAPEALDEKGKPEEEKAEQEF
ncbi:hypothetical protein HNR46_003357 [Haloferula luteola]|uniref:Uncharacterized protein n=1 Tax=Haloferula luteola TaxID=595692 RepID=A0A840VC30_9BACT|nr:hypothetical protein [Haloferula luteola]MBB5353104.1 hypothetical protein [Haloferula luteola]